MPIYEYLCKKCQHEFETLIRGDEKPACPQCGDGDLSKLLSVVAAHTASSSAADNCPVESCQARGGPGCGFGPCGM